MKRRSVKFSYLFSAILILFAVMVFYSKILAPFHGEMLDGIGRFLLGLDALSGGELSGASREQVPGALIIERRSDEFRDILILNKKSAEGSKATAGDVLVGRVISSGDQVSMVRLVTSPGFKIDGVSERSGIPVSLEGKGAGLLETRVPRGTDIQEGDIITHNAGDALVIGTVRKITDVASDPFLLVTVLHAVNNTTLKSVDLVAP